MGEGEEGGGRGIKERKGEEERGRERRETGLPSYPNVAGAPGLFPNTLDGFISGPQQSSKVYRVYSTWKTSQKTFEIHLQRH